MPDLAGKRVHFVGVGGASMCALAEYCLLSGARVSGSDRVLGRATDRLSVLGAQVYFGSREEMIKEADLVVRSSAVPLSDAEVAAARSLGKRVEERQEFLAEVASEFRTVAAVAGTHGKTTVAAMTAHILKSCGIPFVGHIGGEPEGMGNLTVVREKDGSLPRGMFLTEACEFRRHLLALSPDIAVITNMECDHPDCYADINEVRGVFAEFVEKCPLTIVRESDIYVSTGAHIAIREGMGAEHGGGASLYGAHMRKCTYSFMRTLECADGQTVEVVAEGACAKAHLNFPGAHYAEDAVFALALSCELGAELDAACAALETFGGVKRRFEKAGRLCGAELIFDYAHHPTELKCTLAAAKMRGRVLPVFQPHTYSRTARYMADFAAALGGEEEVILMPVYAARECEAQGATSAELQSAICSNYPNCNVYLANSAEDVWDMVKTRAHAYDVVLFLGAGDIYDMKERFCSEGE